MADACFPRPAWAYSSFPRVFLYVTFLFFKLLPLCMLPFAHVYFKDHLKLITFLYVQKAAGIKRGHFQYVGAIEAETW